MIHGSALAKILHSIFSWCYDILTSKYICFLFVFLKLAYGCYFLFQFIFSQADINLHYCTDAIIDGGLVNYALLSWAVSLDSAVSLFRLCCWILHLKVFSYILSLYKRWNILHAAVADFECFGVNIFVKFIFEWELFMDNYEECFSYIIIGVM